MKKKMVKTGNAGHQAGADPKPVPDGYPLYPINEDIYNKYRESENIDPEDISKNKDTEATGRPAAKHSLYGNEAKPGNDLDVPGADEDDADEANGSEDEENNYYSLGGDEHNDLEEDNQ